MLKNLMFSLPALVRIFLFRSLACFLGWQLLYHLLLAPPRKLDGWLTMRTARSTARLLTRLYKPATVVVEELRAVVYIGKYPLIGIADGCNGLDLFVLHLGFVFCFPGQSARRRILFALGGLAGIYLLNIVRCAALCWLHIYHPELTEVAHHYVFTAIVYGAIFWSWVFYLNNLNTVAGKGIQSSLTN